MKQSFYNFIENEEEKKIGIYQITGVLQYVADKNIKKGINIETNQEVAIKKLPQNYEKYSMREAEISMYIKSHKLYNIHIVKIYDIIHIKQDSYLIMELCETDLEEYMKNKNKTKQQESQVDIIIEALEILKQIIKGYQYLAQQFDGKFMHRDIKPKNVLCKDKIFKLCDFEFARFRDLSDPTLRIGTDQYTAPELLINKNNVYDNKCDVYSLGVMLYWMIYQDYQLDLNKITQPGLRRLIGDMIAKEPDQRISFQELIKDSFYISDLKLCLNPQYLMHDHKQLSKILPVSNSQLETYFENYEEDILNINRLFTSILKAYQNSFHIRLIFALWIKVMDKIYIHKNSQELVKIKGSIQMQQILFIKQCQNQNITVEFLSLEELIQYFLSISSKLPDTQMKNTFLQFLQQDWSDDSTLQFPKQVEY